MNAREKERLRALTERLHSSIDQLKTSTVSFVKEELKSICSELEEMVPAKNEKGRS